MRASVLLGRAFLVFSLALGALAASATGQQRQAANRQANGDSLYPPVSYDGRYVAFFSTATNLVNGDTNEAGDVFLHDRRRGTTRRVSLDSRERQANFESTFPSMAGRGRFLAFTSSASNLVRGDTNRKPDVFVRDLRAGTTTRVSVTAGERQVTGVSYNYFPAISAGGGAVAFASNAPNLVPGDTNGTYDVFVRDRRTGDTKLVSAAPGGAPGDGPSLHATISGNGRYVAFQSRASNLVPNDRNGAEDVFVHDRATGTTRRVSLGLDGGEANAGSDRAAISHGGRVVAFSSSASNLAANDRNPGEDVFMVDLNSGRTSLVTKGTGAAPVAGPVGDAICCAISPLCCIVVITDRKSVVSPDGRACLYRSDAGDLVAGDSNFSQDIFLYQWAADRTTRISVDSRERQANGPSVHHGLSFDGRFVAFSSEASNLVRGDTNNASDIFVRDRRTGVTRRISVRSPE